MWCLRKEFFRCCSEKILPSELPIRARQLVLCEISEWKRRFALTALFGGTPANTFANIHELHSSVAHDDEKNQLVMVRPGDFHFSSISCKTVSTAQGDRPGSSLTCFHDHAGESGMTWQGYKHFNIAHPTAAGFMEEVFFQISISFLHMLYIMQS